MAYDALSLSVLTSEFNAVLLDAKINKIYMPNSDEVLFLLYANKKTYRLVISCNTNLNRIHLTNQESENPQNAPAFCMLLRKYLTGSVITQIYQQPFERVIDFSIDTKNELGYTYSVHLIFELTGRDSNLILTDADYKIIDSLRRFSVDLEASRIVLPNAVYKFFPPQEKFSIDAFSDIKNAALKTVDIRDFLTKNVMGIAHSTAYEISVLAQNDAKNIDNALKIYLDNLKNKKPNVIFVNDAPFDVFPFEYISKTGQKVFYNTLNEAHDAFFSQKESHRRFSERSKSINTVLKNAINRTEKKLGLQRQAMLEAENSEQNRIFGDLILSNLHNISKHADYLTTVNFFDESNSLITIPLDKRYTPQQNAQIYYKKYAKQKNSLTVNAKLVEENNQILNYLKSVAQSVKNCTQSEDFEQVTQELTENGFIKAKKADSRKKAQSRITPLIYEVEGFTVTVGKNNVQNDYVTFKIAKGADLWFHTQKIHSSHLIISNPNHTEIPDSVIKTAAEITAYFSQGVSGSKIPVDYCLKKYVKKPIGAKCGFVTYTDYLTIIVDPIRHEESLISQQ